MRDGKSAARENGATAQGGFFLVCKYRALSGLWLALLVASCSAPSAQERADHRPTIVSLNPCSDAILAEFVPPDQLLAISHLSKDPEASSMSASQAARYRATSGSAEEIMALSPDFVVVDPFVPAPTRRALEQVGIAVIKLEVPRTLDDSLTQIRRLGELAGRSAQGEALANAVAEAWRQGAVETEDPVVTLLWQEGGIVPGPDSLIAAMLEHSGFSLHSAARGLGQGDYLPLEEVLADPPQLILSAGSARALHHPVLDELVGTAKRELDPRLLYCGGPTIPRALARLRAIREEMSS